MIVQFTSDLKQQHIYANGHELVQILGMDSDTSGARILTRSETEKKHVVTFDNPVLVTDNYRIGQLSPVLRDTVFALYASRKRKTTYGYTSIDFEQGKYPAVWGPSIDTLLLCKSVKSLKEQGAMDDIRDAAEIGSGSGFVSKYILETIYDLERMTLVDINPQAKECAEQNILDVRMQAVVNTGLNYLNGKKLDLVVCNPPYTPRASTVENNAYEGTGLLSGLIRESPNFLTKKGMLLLNISSLCEKESVALMEKTHLKYQKVDQMIVPLKVLSVLNNSAWMDFLLNNSMTKDTRNGYDYWQTINVYKIERKF